MKTRSIAWVVCGVCLLAFLGTAHAQGKYPTRAIELVSAFAPGGSNTLMARCFIDDLSKILKVSIDLVSRAGTGGMLGTSYVARAKNDGYVLLAASQATHVTSPVINRTNCPYDPVKDFDYIGSFGSVPSVFVVRKESPFKTLGELIEYARKNPGKIKNASAGTGAVSEFNHKILAASAKVEIPSIPFKSGGEAMVAVLGGHIDLTCSSFAAVGSQIKTGEFRALAFTSKKRVPDFPNVPTTAELGFSNVNLNAWQGIVGPAGLPKYVLDVLISSVDKVFHSPDVIQRAAKLGFTSEYMRPEEFKKLVADELSVVGKISEETGLIQK